MFYSDLIRGTCPVPLVTPCGYATDTQGQARCDVFFSFSLNINDAPTSRTGPTVAPVINTNTSHTDIACTIQNSRSPVLSSNPDGRSQKVHEGVTPPPSPFFVIFPRVGIWKRRCPQIGNGDSEIRSLRHDLFVFQVSRKSFVFYNPFGIYLLSPPPCFPHAKFSS